MVAADVIKPEVRAKWLSFNEPFEGRVNWMYLDVKGLVTTGVGNLIDTPAAAATLPWLRSDMTLASRTEVEEAWHKVKGRKDMALHGGGAYRSLTTLRLSEGAIDALVFRRLHEMGDTLQHEHPCFKDLPADVQLAILSMSWAMGPAFHFPKFWGCIERGDYAGAAFESRIAGAGTILRRNVANASLLRRSALTVA